MGFLSRSNSEGEAYTVVFYLNTLNSGRVGEILIRWWGGGVLGGVSGGGGGGGGIQKPQLSHQV